MAGVFYYPEMEDKHLAGGQTLMPRRIPRWIRFKKKMAGDVIHQLLLCRKDLLQPGPF